MSIERRLSRCGLLAASAVLVAASVASPAAADSWRRYKGVPNPPRVVRTAYVAPAPRYVYVRHSDAGAAFAGFIGGVILATAIQQAAAPPPPVVYGPPPAAYCPPPPVQTYYYDPYCGRSYVSLDACSSHFGGPHHRRVLWVMSVESGRRVGTCVWDDGRWRERDWDHHGDWDD